MMPDSIRVRLTLWHLLILALLQGVLCSCIYGYISVHLRRQVDGILGNVLASVNGAIQASPVEGPPTARLAAALANVKHTETPIAIYAADGSTLAERPNGSAYLTPLETRPEDGVRQGVYSGDAVRHVGARRFAIEKIRDPGSGTFLYIAVSTSLYSRLDELRTARVAFLIGIPVMLLLTACGGWVLTGRSLAPAVSMAERARHIGADNRSERLSAPRKNDELGRLAVALNELLDRLADARDADHQFMADAAHELRTPLSVMQNAAAVTLMDPEATIEEHRVILVTIQRYIQRMTRSVNDVFRLARADAGYKSLEWASLYLDEIVAEAGEAAEWLAQTKEIAVQIALAPVSPYVGDPKLLYEMVLNLLENSTKYTPRGGLITIALRLHNDAYEISVSDTGTGIGAIDRDRIFDRFYRASPSEGAKEGVQGTGLGLAIARWIAESHHGTLELLVSQDVGSTFLIRLPLQ